MVSITGGKIANCDGQTRRWLFILKIFLYPGIHMIYSKKIHSSIVFSLIISILLLSSCNTAPTTVTNFENTVTATQVIIPSETATSSPTLSPSATTTIEPTPTPSFTPTPELALVEENLVMWSVPKDYLILISDSGISKEAFSLTYDAYVENEIMNVRVPASGVIVEVEFNQPVSDELVFNVYDLNSEKPWYTTKFIANTDNSLKGYFLLNHNFVLDPPFWEITYNGKLENVDGKIFWEKDLRLFKALPNTCWDGSLPDPVTLYCPNYDGDWNYRDFPNFNPNADIFTSGQVELGEEYKD